jgi:DNA-binding MarR family transcriptional regulator
MTARTSAKARPVADALHSAAIHLLRGVRRQDERAGLGPAGLSALSVLVFGGPMRLTDLARVEQVRPPTMTKIVDALVRRGLVRKDEDVRDARAVRLEATARGRRVLNAARRRRVDRLAAVLASLPPPELELLARGAAILSGVTASLRAGEGRAKP